jgi:DNA-directed RNA polymerase subunit M/transcription elongation factor TFIIS
LSDQTEVRIQTAEDPAKSFQQYDALRRMGRISNALIIARLANGNWAVLMQKGRPEDVTAALMVGVSAMQAMDEKAKQIALPAALAEPLPDDGSNPARAFKNKAQITTKPDGSLQAPPGEAFTHCGECGHSRFFALGSEADDAMTRLCCCECGNEIRLLRIFHNQGGRG